MTVDGDGKESVYRHYLPLSLFTVTVTCVAACATTVMFHIIYQIIIAPLVTLTEFFFVLFTEVAHDSGVAVMGLSFVVTLLTLPLYMVAEKWQEKERLLEAALAPKTARIKAVFSGDERYMMLSALYRESRYHPIMALRSSFSLAIQVPFFIAAYNFLSNLVPLKGASFLFIRDMGSPDGIIRLGAIHLNLLPIAMTVINCIAGAVYSKGHPARERVQIYALAAVFLVLLYNSPAALVLYWTMNNVLSLVKNVFYKIKHPRKVLYVLGLFASALLVIAAICLTKTKTIFRLMLVIAAAVIPACPFAARRAARIIDRRFTALDKDNGLCGALFALSAAALALLAGLVVPSMLVESEVVQFCYVDDVASPFVFIRETLWQAIGFFLCWPACFYALFGRRVKKALAVLFVFIAIASVINCFAFSLNYGPLDSTLLFMQPQKFHGGAAVTALNMASMIAAAAAAVFLSRCSRHLASGMAVLLIALAAISARNTAVVYGAYHKMTPPVVADKVENVFHLSRTERNVIVLMQDRLYSPFVAEFLKERPEMKDRLDGFTYYPNCVSPAHLTMLGTPGIFGGYDYTPYYINKRTDKTLQQKHNEAILTMPVLFHEAGWRTAVADMPYENYLEYPTEDAYNGYPFVNRVITRGVYSPLWYARHGMKMTPYASIRLKRNMMWFSLFKMAMPAIRQIVYHGKYWLSYDDTRKLSFFVDNYSEIDLLSELTGIDDGAGSFMLLDNEATHETILLQAPNYVIAAEVTDYGEGEWSHCAQYHSTAGILMRLADFFDWMKKNGVYDNTRIIIVSDHGGGKDTGAFLHDEMPFAEYGKDYRRSDYAASLLVKDFDKRGTLKKDMAFMTNADTPALATEGIIKDARNPFTHNLLAAPEDEKSSRIYLAAAPAESTRIRHNTQFKVAEDEWYTVKDDIYKAENWDKAKP